MGCTCSPNEAVNVVHATSKATPQAAAPERAAAGRDALCRDIADEQELTVCHAAWSLATGDFQGVVTRFTLSLRPLLPAARLEAAWTEETRNLGPLLNVWALSSSVGRKGSAVQLVLRFAESDRLIESLVRPSGELASLAFGAAPRRWEPPDYARPERFNEYQVTLGRTPVLAGKLTVPKRTKPMPAVVLVHGSGPADEDCSSHLSGLGNKLCKDLAWGLSSAGIVVLRYQKRSFVDPAPSRDFESEVIRDVCDARALLASRPEADAQRIAVIGHSLGGALLPRVTRACGGFSSLVLLSSPARPMLDVLTGQVAYLGWHSGNPELTSKRVATFHDMVKEVRLPTGAAEEEFELLGSTAPRSYWQDMLDLDPTLDVAQVALPIFVVQGERDYQVGLADYDRWKAALHGRTNARFQRFPGLDHTLAYGTGPSSHYDYYLARHVDAAVITELVRWLSPTEPQREGDDFRHEKYTSSPMTSPASTSHPE